LVFIHPGLTFLNPKPRYHDLPGHVEKRWWPTMAFGSVKNPTTPLNNHTFRQWKTTPLFKHVLYRNLHLRDVPACHVSLRRSTSACYLSIVPGYGPWLNPQKLKHGEDRPFSSMSCLLRWCSINCDLNNIFYHIFTMVYCATCSSSSN
jgi:hypothetical protein